MPLPIIPSQCNEISATTIPANEDTRLATNPTDSPPNPLKRDNNRFIISRIRKRGLRLPVGRFSLKHPSTRSNGLQTFLRIETARDSVISLQVQTHGNEYFSKDTELRQFTGSEREKFRRSFRGWKQRGRSGKSEKNPGSRRTKCRNPFEKKRRQSGVVGVSMASIAAPLFLPQATWPFGRRPEVTSHFSKRAEMRCPLDRGRSRSRIENPVASAMSYVPFLMVGFLVSFETAPRGGIFQVFASWI